MSEALKARRVWTVNREPDTDGEFGVGLLYVGAVLHFEDVRVAVRAAHDLNELELYLAKADARAPAVPEEPAPRGSCWSEPKKRSGGCFPARIAPVQTVSSRCGRS